MVDLCNVQSPWYATDCIKLAKTNSKSLTRCLLFLWIATYITVKSYLAVTPSSLNTKNAISWYEESKIMALYLYYNCSLLMKVIRT